MREIDASSFGFTDNRTNDKENNKKQQPRVFKTKVIHQLHAPKNYTV